MYHPGLKKYLPDSLGSQVIIDLEAACGSGVKTGEIYQVGIVGFGALDCYQAEILISPEAYENFADREAFTIDGGALTFNVKSPYWQEVLERGVTDLYEAALNIESQLHVMQSVTDAPLVVYCRGTDYDIALLSHFFSVLGFKVPWHHRNTRDLRTLYAMHPWFTPKAGNHSALDDARTEKSNLVTLAQRSAYFNEYASYRHGTD